MNNLDEDVAPRVGEAQSNDSRAVDNFNAPDAVTQSCGTPEQVSSFSVFPAEDDWAGWIDIWCREDTGNIDCVPECLRPPVLPYVTSEGWMKFRDMVPDTPYKVARWMHLGGWPKPPMPPWFGSSLSPSAVERLKARAA